MLGNLFMRGQIASDLNNMTYTEIKYWDGWHDIMMDSENPDAKKKNKKVRKKRKKRTLSASL
jgi:hypothetical protein